MESIFSKVYFYSCRVSPIRAYLLVGKSSFLRASRRLSVRALLSAASSSSSSADRTVALSPPSRVDRNENETGAALAGRAVPPVSFAADFRAYTV